MSPALRVRLAKARTVIDAYTRFERYDAYDEAVIDVLTDLMHYCGAIDIDFGKVLEHARFHHDAEVQP